jgi:effector-binding domain-containing protein
MKALKYLLYFLLGVAALIGGLGLFAKNTYHIERSITIDAPKSLVYDQVRLFKNFHEWSPWSKLDPDMKLSFTGNDGTVGATYSWNGNKNVGEGTQTMKAVAADRLDLQLDFKKPFESTVPVFFNVTGDETKTKVTWGFDPHFPFPINIWAMFTDVDKAMGADYARGLGYLKRRCESMAHKKYNGYEVLEEEMPETFYAGIRRTIPLEEMTDFYNVSLPKIIDMAAAEKITIAGSPAGMYWTFDEAGNSTDMAVAFPVKEDKKLPKEYQFYKVGGTKAMVIDFLGAYDSLKQAHIAMEAFMAGNKLQMVPPCIESYVTDPTAEPDTAKWLTKVIYFMEPMQDSAAVKK